MFKGDFRQVAPLIMKNGEKVIRYTARFKVWQGPEVEDTWNGKLTFDFNGQPQWGEFAVLLSLANNWEGYAVECYNGLYYWKTSPFHPPHRRISLNPPQEFRDYVDKIAWANGLNRKNNYSGCWDLLAKKGNEFRFIEVKRHKRDSFRETQYNWFNTAYNIGIPASSFVVVEWLLENEPHPYLESSVISFSQKKTKTIINKEKPKVPKIKTPSTNQTGKWDEASFFSELENKTLKETVTLINEIYNWIKSSKYFIDWGTGKQFGTFIPKVKYKESYKAFCNFETRGLLWITQPKMLFSDNSLKNIFLDFLRKLPVSKGFSPDIINNANIVIDINLINTPEKNQILTEFIKWAFKQFNNK